MRAGIDLRRLGQFGPSRRRGDARGASGIPDLFHAPQLPGQSNGNGEAASPVYVSKFLASSDGLALTKAFMRIKDPSLRRRIVELVKELAGDDLN
jgi:hypothetical protein